MNRSITLAVIIVVFFFTWFNSAPIYASFNKAPCGYSKSVVASSSTILVPDNYTTIQEAINKANEGDTIFVAAGTYYEHVKIDKSLTLVGENRSTTVIDGNGTGIVVYVIANNITLSGFTIQNGESGIWFWYSNDNVFTSNTALNNGYGIYLSYSASNVISGNTVSNNQYGVQFYYSSSNVLSGNTVSNSNYGIYFLGSSNNAFSGNTVTSNQYGIYLDGSGYNALTGNNVSSNDYSGIRFYHSSNNAFSGNTVTSNQYGIYLSDSSNNAFSGNTVTSNQYGIYLSDSSNNAFSGNTVTSNKWGTYLYYSRDNILTGNKVSSNYYGIRLTSSSNNNALTGNKVSSNYYGIRLTSSNNNTIYHNNFINNTEPASSINSVNSWDNGGEGNYWSVYDGDDANWDGIGDAAYSIYQNNQDNYPLMATFLQFTIVKKNQSYKINTVSSSKISNFQYRYDPDNKVNAANFKVNDAEGKGFCRISIAHTLIEPPYTVTVDQNSPLYFGIVYTNGTHTWLYFTYEPSEHEVILMHTPYPEQLVLSRWAILGLTIIIIIMLSININYYRKFNKQKKVIEVYERELGSFLVSHPEHARLRFVRDVIERKDKIEKFKKKYGINIQPAGTLEDLMEKMGVKKES